MGIFKKIGKGIGKVFKKIGKGVKKVFKKFGKFMGKIGIVGQLAMMFILPGIGAALMKGFGALWTGVVGQTAAQGAAAAATTGAATTAAATAGGASAAAAAASGATAAAGVSTAASGLLGSSSAILRGAGMVLEKGAQFARTIQAGYKTVSQAVTGAFTETGKWIGGKLGMKTAEGVAMKGSWANYSQAVTDSFTDFKGNVSDFWSPIKDGPTLDVGLDNLTKKATDVTGGLNVSGEFGTGTGAENLVPEINVSGEFGTGAAVSEPVNSLLDKKGSYFKDTVLKGKSIRENLVDYKDGVVADIIATPGNMLKQEAANAIFGQEPLEIEEERAGLYGNYVPEFRGNADIYAQAAAPASDFVQFITGNEQTFGNYGVKEGQFGGAAAYSNYFNRLQNSGAPS